MTNLSMKMEKIKRLAAEQGITSREYKRRCDERTARNKGLTPAEYSKKRVEDAAKKKNMTVQEYRKLCYENTAQRKGFCTYKDYDKANKRAKRLGLTQEQYNNTLNKDENGYYIV